MGYSLHYKLSLNVHTRKSDQRLPRQQFEHKLMNCPSTVLKTLATTVIPNNPLTERLTVSYWGIRRFNVSVQRTGVIVVEIISLMQCSPIHTIVFLKEVNPSVFGGKGERQISVSLFSLCQQSINLLI